MDRITRFWALHYHVLEALREGMDLSRASITFVGESWEAALYFRNWLDQQVSQNT